MKKLLPFLELPPKAYGVAIQIVTHQRYRDQGGHENIVNPANP